MSSSWASWTPERVASELGVSPTRGLSEAEAAARRRRYGMNALPEAPAPGVATLVARQFKSFVILLLLAAAVLSWALGEAADALAIALVLVLNAGVGFVLDYRAEREIAALRALAAPRARTRRDGHVLELPVAELVPGDVVLVEAGDRVGADGRLIAGRLEVDESLLTGESVPAFKQAEAVAGAVTLMERHNEVFAGTMVTLGAGTMVVTATGLATEVGRIGAMLAQATARTPLAERLDALGRTVVWLFASVTAVIVMIGMLRRMAFWPLLETGVALAIAAIPEGLPAVATVALAAGAHRLARRGMLLRRLGALEALGTVTTLCLDKTGTLTANAMTVQRVVAPGHVLTVTGEGWAPEGGFEEDGRPVGALPEGAIALLRAAAVCNEATLERHGAGWHVHGDPSEGALLVAAAKAGLADPRAGLAVRTTEHPGPGRPWMVVEAEAGAYLKGAPEQVMARCALAPAEREAWRQANARLAGEALRVLGVAERPGPAGTPWRWLGLVGMADPPRSGAEEALAAAHAAGIRTVMLTGDHPTTAEAIARRLGLPAEGPPRVAATRGDLDADVHARVTPEDKLALVSALEGRGEVVAMSGDGVNDAPALRHATVGVAMGGGTEVAKEAAAAVLTDQRLSTLLMGVGEGRAAFLNIQRAVDYLLTCSIATVMTVALNTAAGFPLPLLPLQILYLNLLTHSVPALGLALEPPAAGIMARPPLPARQAFLGPARLATILWHGVIIALVTLAAGGWGAAHESVAHGRTLAFATLGANLILHAFTDRSTAPFGGWRLRGNPAFLAFLGVAAALQLAAVGLPALRSALGLTSVAPADVVSVLAAAAIAVVAIETSKRHFPPD